MFSPDGAPAFSEAAGKRRAHHRHGGKHVRPQQRAPGRHRRTEIVADHGRDRAIAERGHQPEGVAHEVEQTKRRNVAVVAGVPSGGAAIAALVRRHHVKAGGRQRPHHLAPRVGQLGKAVQQQQARVAGLLEPGL